MNTQAYPSAVPVYPSVALHLGAALISSTAITTIFLPSAGIAPILVILAIYLAACFLIPDRFITSAGRRALAVSGGISSLGCHFILAWFIHAM
ncbi:MAG: hypothetical protein G8D91_21905 [gamma proteobacterium symbiont of Clathrolucina costata]